MSSFVPVQKLIARRFEAMHKDRTVFTVDPDRDAIWKAYIEAFETPELKQEHMCSACRAFIRQAGGAVSIGDNLEYITLWSPEDLPEHYFTPAFEALDSYVRSLPIAGLFHAGDINVGVQKNADAKRNVVWHHFHVEVPRDMVDCSGSMVRRSGQLRDSKNVLKRGIEELQPDAVQTVLELIEQGTLYRGVEYKASVAAFQKIQNQYRQKVEAGSAESRLENFCWLKAGAEATNVARIRNTAIGTLLVDLSEGRDLEQAVRAYERVTAPANYKRPKALVTPRMVEKAKQRLEELGLIEALNRRRLDTRDLTAENALFTFRPRQKAKDVFAEIAGDTPVDTKKLDRVDEISIADFVDKVLPKAKAVRVLFEREHAGNLVTLTGPQDPEAHNLMMWDNSYGWSYTGGMADSIKERVKAAGGQVEGNWMRISLSWNNTDDLDLHLVGKGPGWSGHIMFSRKQAPSIHAALDVDMNIHGESREPVENIHVRRQLPDGRYEICVHNYTRRESQDTGFDVEVELADGEMLHFGSHQSPGGQQEAPRIPFLVKDGVVSFGDTSLSRSASGVTKWGLKTGIWHPVRAITLSPNHWTRPVGNKHWFFLLEGAVSDEPTRPFYNEFLTRELQEDRKTTEVLASKIEVAPAEGAELSGLGFSETMRNHLFVEVDGEFKRTLKVNF